MTNANTESILFSRVGIYTLDCTTMRLKIQEHLMEKGYHCHLGYTFILAFRINYKLEDTREVL